MNLPTVKYISECFIKPKCDPEKSKQPYYLSHWDLHLLSCHYNQKGLLFGKPKQGYSLDDLLESLKDSLELALDHFYPLAGQLATNVDEDKHRCLVYIDCNKGSGVRFLHASLDMTVSDILSPTRVPSVVRSFFDHSSGVVVNHDGHTRPLLSVQVTELVDGMFIGCSMNHVLVDGTSFWHFWSVWSEIHRANRKPVSISRLPIHKRWVPDGYGPTDLYLPFTHPDEFISRYEPPPLEERFFHFSSETLAKLKARANTETGNASKVSSYQALLALVWRSIVRAKRLQANQVTHCKLAANNRTRLDPPLPEEYFGNSLAALTATTTVGELLEHSLGWVALQLHQSVVNHTDKAVREFDQKWLDSPFVQQFGEYVDSDSDSTVLVGSSPRFNIYGNTFLGLGKPLAVRSGFANKFGAKVNAYPGYEGGGNVDLEICLPADSMSALESDEEFMAAVSSPVYGS